MPDSPAKAAWNAEHTTTVTLKLNNRTDADILAKLASVPNRQGYIKKLIRNTTVMDTGELVDAIPRKYRYALDLYHKLFERYRDCDEQLAEAFLNKMGGYLECMKDIGIITESGRDTIFLWYDRRNRLEEQNLIKKDIESAGE